MLINLSESGWLRFFWTFAGLVGSDLVSPVRESALSTTMGILYRISLFYSTHKDLIMDSILTIFPNNIWQDQYWTYGNPWAWDMSLHRPSVPSALSVYCWVFIRIYINIYIIQSLAISLISRKTPLFAHPSIPSAKRRVPASNEWKRLAFMLC